MTKTSNTVNTSHNTATCSMCRKRAFARCQRCGRLLCLSHMPVDTKERCNECELQFGQTRSAIARVIGPIVLSTVLFLPVVLLWLLSRGELVFDGGHVITAMAFTTLAVGLELWIGGIAWRLRRRRFLLQGGHAQLLGGLEVPIAAAQPHDERSVVLGEPFLGRRRLEPPVPPIWARTYGVG